MRYDLAKRKKTTLVPAVDSYRLSGDLSRIIYVLDKQVTSVPSDTRWRRTPRDL